MKVTLNWLKQYVDFNWSPEELTERLTMLGLEVEGVQKISGAFDGIVVAQVVSRDKHPNADKLSLCRVNDGTDQPFGVNLTILPTINPLPGSWAAWPSR